MANIKFFRVIKTYWDDHTPMEGYIWFNPSNNTIQIYKDGKWEVYTGKVNDVEYENGTLVITKHDGKEISISLGDVQNISDLSTRLGTLETSFNALSGEFETVKSTTNKTSAAVATIINQLKNIAEEEEAVKKYVDNKMSTHEAARETIDAGFTNSIGALETTTNAHTNDISDLKGLVGTTAVATQITNAINDLDNGTNGVSDTGEKVTVTVKQENGKVTSVTVAEDDIASAQALDTLTTTVADNKAALEEAINTEKGRIDTLIGDGDGSIRDIAVDVLTETLVSETASEAFDTLQEVSAWIKKHPENAATMNQSISDNASAISGLTGRVENLEKIDHDAYKAADTALETALKSYADTAEADALTSAKAYTDTLANGQVKTNTTDIATNTGDITTIKGQITTINTAIEENELTLAGALNDINGRLDNLASGTVSSVTGEGYISATTTDGAVVVTATTGSVANNSDALAVASDVKSYVDSTWTWGEF